MKKSFYQQINIRRRHFPSLVVGGVVFVTVILVAVQILGFMDVQGLSQRFVFPLWSSKNNTSTVLISVFIESLKGNRRLVEENDRLRSTIESNETLSLQNRMLSDENKVLHSLLGRSRFSSLVLAPVLRTPPGTFYDTLLVDVGKETGIQPGNRVVVNGNIVIGTLSEINGRVGMVVLFSTPGIETEVFLGTSTAHISARGQGGGNFIAEVPRELEVHEGDLITLPGYPTLLFSTIEKIESNPSDPFQSIFFQNIVNVNKLSFVQIVTDNEEVFEAPLPSATDEMPQPRSEEELDTVETAL